MIKISFACCLVVLFAVLYWLAPHISMPNKYVVVSVIISPFAISYMSYMVLKYGQPSDHKFDDRHYEDMTDQ